MKGINRQSDASKHPLKLHSGVLERPRVLLVTHDVPSRLFQQWAWRELNLPVATATMPGEDQEPEPTEVLVSQVLTQLLRLGNHLLTATKVGG